MAAHWRCKHDDAGIAWLHLGIAGTGANVLSAAVFEELDEILTKVVSSTPKGVVFVSDKPGGFIAGADVKEFQGIRTRADALAIVARGQKIMDRIEALPCPTVAAIDGFCLGGGLELALACDYRVALDAPRTRLGLPEIKLGIHPGFGGTVRSVRLLGPVKALDLMLTGKTLDARQAQKAGLVDHVVPARHLLDAARRLVETRPPQRTPDLLARFLNARSVRPIVAASMRKRVAAKAKPEHYPAPFALINLWRRHADDERMMLAREAESVADLSFTDTARNLVRVFMLQNRLKALGDKRAFRPRHAHVIGAGTMGGEIAVWIALQGFRVTVQDKRPEALTAMLKRAPGQFARNLKLEPRIRAATDRLIPDPNGLGLDNADVVIEAIVEDPSAKQALYREIEPAVKPDALLATNTSSLPIERLSEGLSDPRRLVGLHFFNPVARMPLVEVNQAPGSHRDMIEKALAFVRHIDKLPVVTKSAPGFLVNRVLTPYLLEAMVMVEEGVGVAGIDQAARDFGMPMGPLELADAVGLDIALHVGEIMAAHYDLKVPDRLKLMVAAGQLGQKSGQGFYRYMKGKPVRTAKSNHTGNPAKLQERLISKLISEAAACLREGVVEDADLIDAAIVFGIGFAPFRGGPLHYRAARQRDVAQRSVGHDLFST